MIWHLLWLYPLIGFGVGIYYTAKFARYDETWDTGTGIFAVLALTLVWPYGWRIAHQESSYSKVDAAKRKELVADELFNRVRREERQQVKREMEEFDRELGIEPEWKKAHPYWQRG